LTLLFGASFRAGSDAFRLLLASTGLLFLHGTLHNVFLVRDRLRLQAWIFGGAAGVNLVLNLLFIPRYGLVGSALATLIAEGIILTAGLAAVRSWGWRPTLAPLGRPTLAAALMAMVLLVLPAAVPVGVRIGAGGLTYVAVLGLAGGFPPEVKRLLRFSGT
jgi:O-antigen/teichoic acid export membrane protein